MNARVHLPGSRGRSAVITNNIEYVATREGADKSATVDDLRRSELAEKMGLVGYYAERPGSTALFDQNGAVPLRTARRELEKADGAIATVVLSVRRDEACELDLACKEDWQRFCRRNLAPALAEAMGIPESSVRWVAAEHENHPNSKHAHVIAWSSDGSFDSLMARNRLDRARNALTDDEIGVTLPADGRISYAHLRRWHPDVAKAVDVAIAEAGSRHPEIKGASAAYSKSVERCAGLKGLESVARDRYVNDAMRELRARQGNALLRIIAPDRTTDPERELMRSARPDGGPATERKRMKPLVGEVRACVTGEDLEGAREAVRELRPIPERCLRSCPSYALSMAKAPVAVSRALTKALAFATENPRSKKDPSDEVGQKAERALARALAAAASAAIRGDTAGIVLDPAKTIVKGMIL